MFNNGRRLAAELVTGLGVALVVKVVVPATSWQQDVILGIGIALGVIGLSYLTDRGAASKETDNERA